MLSDKNAFLVGTNFRGCGIFTEMVSLVLVVPQMKDLGGSMYLPDK